MAWTIDIARDLMSPETIPRSSPQSCKRHASVAKYFRMFPKLRSVITEVISNVIRVTDPDHKPLFSLREDTDLWHLGVASAFLKLDIWRKEELPAKISFVSQQKSILMRWNVFTFQLETSLYPHFMSFLLKISWERIHRF